MKALLKKEFQFASPLSYFFLAFSTMALIPNYPILLAAFFICFGVFHSFQAAREANDTLYTAMLPVKKGDVVRARFLFTVLIQMAAFVLMGGFVLLRVLLLNAVVPYVQSTLMNANLAYLGYVLLVYAAFNVLFVGGFYKTAYKLGVPFILFAVAAFLLIMIGEALHFLPGLSFLNADFHYAHVIVFGVGALLYSISTFLCERHSRRSFLKIDL